MLRGPSSSGSRPCCATTTQSTPANRPAACRATARRRPRAASGAGGGGPKMAVEYKNGNRYVCNALQRSQAGHLCQHLPADPIDACVVAAFFAAVSADELQVWIRAQDARRQAEEALERAEAQQVERLRYQALLAERQFNRVDPDNRLVASELEHRWEVALG